MPANLTAQYLKAEAAYRQASTPEDELECLQEMLREIPKHKGTDKLQADLKQKIKKLRLELQQQNKKGRRRGGVRIPRQGAGRALILGAPNAGKSSLLRALTRAHPEVAEFPFTTREPIPGMMSWEDVMVQLIDTPPITTDVLDPTVMGLIRGADVALWVVDVGTDEGIEQAPEVLEHLNRTKTRLGTVTELDEQDLGVTYTCTFLLTNKIDLEGSEERRALFHEFCPVPFQEFPISAAAGTGLDPLREAVYRALDVVRVYTKHPSQKEPDYDRPYTIRRGGTLREVAELIHKDFATQLRSARVWGSEVHDGTPVKGDYVLHDRDVIELHV